MEVGREGRSEGGMECLSVWMERWSKQSPGRMEGGSLGGG